MNFEIIPAEADDYEPEERPYVEMVRPCEERFEAYARFCEATFGSVPASDAWLVPDGPTVRAYKGTLLAKKYDLARLGFPEFWAFDGAEMVGMLFCRKRLTQEQRTWGGHMRVVVRPDRRKCGYGTEILRVGYKGARKLVADGDELLLTVDVKDKAGWKMVRHATYDRLNVVQPKRKGAPAMVYRFLLDIRRSAEKAV